MTTENDTEERRVLCSSCVNVFPESRIHIIPHFNGSVGRYVTTFRCGQCLRASLDETRARLARSKDRDEIESLCALLASHGVFLHEFQRGDPVPVVRKILEQTLDLLQSGAIRLSIGPLV